MNLNFKRYFIFVVSVSLTGIVESVLTNFLFFSILFYDARTLIGLLSYRIIITWMIAPMLGTLISKILNCKKHVQFAIYIIALSIYVLLGIYSDEYNDSTVFAWNFILYSIYLVCSLPMVYIIKVLSVKLQFY